MNLIVNLMFPMGTLLTLNLAIYRGLKRLHKPLGSAPSRKERETCSTPTEFEPNSRKPRILSRRVKTNGHRAAALSLAPVDEEERERDARYTRASILMVLAFGLCHSPRLITNTVEMFIDQAHLPAVS
jgi:hypothetical protein